ncbi:hypothetical protein [Desulfurispora thermophila]|uniref:hypothetical protein n=1 Tax=Desulfurispora thermophila TaxID=265470 RepID=UPI00036DD659|nr:hypothetical protein [Desulfurispora thermophila]
MLIQHDPSKPNETIRLAANKLIVAPFSTGSINCAGGTFDLEPYQGKAFRLYLEKDGSLSTDVNRDHFWLLAETTLPPQRYESVATDEVDQNGMTIYKSVPVPLDLESSDVQVTVFPLPEVV